MKRIFSILTSSTLMLSMVLAAGCGEGAPRTETAKPPEAGGPARGKEDQPHPLSAGPQAAEKTGHGPGRSLMPEGVRKDIKRPSGGPPGS